VEKLDNKEDGRFVRIFFADSISPIRMPHFLRLAKNGLLYRLYERESTSLLPDFGKAEGEIRLNHF
jgi:hypothetical protein